MPNAYVFCFCGCLEEMGEYLGPFFLGVMSPCLAFRFPQEKESVLVYLLEGWTCNQEFPLAAVSNPPAIN